MELILSICIIILLAVMPVAVIVLQKQYESRYEEDSQRIKDLLRNELSREYEQQFDYYKYEFEQAYEERKKEAAKKSSDGARNTLRGQLLQQFAPTLKGDYNLFDYRFLGDFADYIIIDGYTEVKDGKAKDIRDIIFVEIKTGESKLSKHQQAVKRAIEEGRVKWGEVKLDVNGNNV